MGQIAFAISSVPEVPIIQNFDVKQHSMKKAQDKSLGTLQLIMMRFTMISHLKHWACFSMIFPDTTPEIILLLAPVCLVLQPVKWPLLKQLLRKQLQLAQQIPHTGNRSLIF
jgi:hypothetical protein